MVPGGTIVGPLIGNIPTVFNNAVTGFNNLVSSGTAIPQVPQYFFTVPFANNQAVLYKLEIVSDPPITPSSFIFPLTPNNVTKQVINLTNYYDVRGNANNYGVQRIIDQFGLTPPIITISGTTGFQFHSLDNYQWSGKSSFALLVHFIQTYAYLVASVTNSSQPSTMPAMLFTDGFTGETFNVVPIGQQSYAMDSARPIIQTYNIQFLAQSTITPIAINISQLDSIAQVFILTKAFLTAGALSWWNDLLNRIPFVGTPIV